MYSIVVLCFLALVGLVLSGRVTEEFKTIEVNDATVHTITNEGQYRMIAKHPAVWAVLITAEESRCETSCSEAMAEFEKMAAEHEDMYFAKLEVAKPGSIAMAHRFGSFEDGFPSIRFLQKEYTPEEKGLLIHSPQNSNFDETRDSLKSLLENHELSKEHGYTKLAQES
mmetsp:Transcript_39957/g.58823  ORF Transcript_39957/g.58823 Transcript_39957/m.58823 type:complete len:169 (-) Transcript_39957:23-529(-)|eukprot:CAMPEP_0194582096 /NCGR_PEP_ID=MMETSP0292-20121207/15357_1 /TAXON_ID=39354 /ORGANISM="Heterosigma akashiwo, Strain CCMP2393" /LENGTH=168 /DNA_ID=CAMNT_0039436095 /DNA_START=91 /DNA_END=597 /DNA_ORIENTATION=-